MERRTPLVTGSTRCTPIDGNRMTEPRYFDATDFVNFFLVGYTVPCEGVRHVWWGDIWPLLKGEENTRQLAQAGNLRPAIIVEFLLRRVLPRFRRSPHSGLAHKAADDREATSV